MKIALVSPESDGRKSVPNGIRILGGLVAEKHLGDVKIFDGSFYESEDGMILDINSYQPDIIGVSCFADSMARTVKILKESQAKVKVAGGPQASVDPQGILKYCDFVFTGEAEISFEKFVRSYLDSGHYTKQEIRGISFKEGDKIKTTPFGEIIEDLDILPFEGWELIKDSLHKMKISPYWHLSPNFMNLMSSRGCTNHCIFCLASKLNGERIRYRSVDNLEAEINLVNALRDNHGMAHLESILFDDPDLFNRDNLEELFGMLKKHNLTYSGFASINNSNPETIKLAAKMGLKTLLFGIETNEKNRGKMGVNKNFSDEKAKTILELCRKEGIFTSACYIIGFPWESREDILKTVDCMLSLPMDYPGISVLDIYPATAVWKYRNKQKSLSTDSFSYLGVESLDSRMDLPSPNPNLTRKELKRIELEAYSRAYTQERVDRTMAHTKTDLDRQRAKEMFDSRKKFIEKGYHLMEKK